MVHTTEDTASVMTTKDLDTSKPYSLHINRDDNGNAKGGIYLDNSDLVSDYTQGNFEKYELSLQGKSLIRYKLNESPNSQDLGFVMDKIVIQNAESLKDTDFACYQSQYPGEGIKQLDAPVYNETDKTLTLKATAGDNLRMFYIPWFNFGKTGSDLSLCTDNAAGY